MSKQSRIETMSYIVTILGIVIEIINKLKEKTANN